MSLECMTIHNQDIIAEKRISGILEKYLKENINNQTWSWYATAFSEKTTFYNYVYNRDKHLNIDQIKAYVETMAEKFTAYLPWALGMAGNSDLKNTLLNEIKIWPTYIELLEKEKTISDKKIEALTTQNHQSDENYSRLLTKHYSLKHTYEKLTEETLKLIAQEEYRKKNAEKRTTTPTITTTPAQLPTGHPTSEQKKTITPTTRL